MSQITLDVNNNNSLDIKRIDINSSYDEDPEVKAIVKSFEGMLLTFDNCSKHES